MKTLVKKTMGLLMATSVLLIGASATSAFAEGSDTVTNDNALTSLAQLDANGQPTIAQPSKVINDTYWSDLEKISITNSQNKTYYGVLPKYVLKPRQTALSKLGIYAGGNGSVDAFPSTGISETEYGIKILDYMAFYRFGYLVGEDTYAPPFKDRPSTEPIPDRVNPYKFTAAELLTQDEIKNPMKLTVYADIKKKDSKDSTSVDEYKPGEALPLDFTVNASWFKRYIMGFTLDRTRTGYMSDEEIKQEHDSYGTFDSQIVYTLDIPEGVDVNNPSATLSGLDGFDVTTEVKNENGKKILIVSLRLKEDKRGKTAKWKDTIEKLRKLDTSNIKISVSGLSVSSTATENKNITLRGTASGFFEWATARSQDLSSNNTNAAHVHLYFAAKQSEAGRDSAADKTKPNLISYSFKVKKPAQNTVTFKDGDKTHATVKVETGKAIDTDALTDQSMPKYPAKAGYIFKEWNTQADGKGTAFTGDTVVNGNMTVYAIYTKDYVPIPEPTQNTVTFINGDKEYAKVKVENGKSISGDALYTESMPKNPAKEGYVFKEWNTQSDGKGTAFTGDTIVNKDMKVYAIYDKKTVKPEPKKPVNPSDNPEKPEDPSDNPEKPVNPDPQKPEEPSDNPKKPIANTKLPETGDNSNLFIYGIVLGLSGLALAITGYFRKNAK
ncbi:InlB B-repeat-containing protein [Granulicatella elegans]|uniref:InlB B-repeat-containing protein n=1 Tax=Granulicatella elegans TaxID=137732 RepID=UPI001D13DAD0|nr:InlB B-repeat-containing protein [Granulicatella elegans]UEA31308.1 InlB B-repeat-containing protein [Granulicatella elegans]